MSDRRRQQHAPRWGNPRPARPEWQLSQQEAWAMITRPHFARFVVVRVVRRQVLGSGGLIVIRRLAS